jgi:glycosyltransferase involved in cell wall biosynthesis
MTRPKISIIIPVYGVEKYLRQCLDSATRQTLEDIEIIIVDDGSTDSCPAIIDKYAAKDSRIKAIHQENAGYGASCNTGIVHANGEYIAILEPDDFIAPDMYKKLHLRAQKTAADIVRCEFVRIGESGRNPEEHHYCGIPDKPDFTLEEAPSLLTCPPSVWAAIYRREFLKRSGIRMREAKGAGQVDINFTMETYFASRTISLVHEPLYYYRINEGSSVKKGDNPTLEALRWQETDLSLCRYPERQQRLKSYLWKAKITMFKWVLLDRVDKKYRPELLAAWQPLFRKMNPKAIPLTPPFNKLDYKILTHAGCGNLKALNWCLLGEQKKRIFSIQFNQKRLRLYMLRNWKHVFYFKRKFLKFYNFELSIGEPE